MTDSRLLLLLVLLLTSLTSACALDDEEDSEEQTEEASATEDSATDDEDTGLVLDLENYQQFLSVALRTRPTITFEGYPVGLFATYLGVDDVEATDTETTIVTHECDGVVGSAVTTQYIQLAAEGESEPLYGIEGDYTEAVLSNCTRDGFIHSGTFSTTLTEHTEYDASDIGSILNFTIADSLETVSFSSYYLENISTGESVSLSGDYNKTLRYESEAAFNDTGERTITQYTDQITSASLAIATGFATGSNINQQFTSYVEVETEDTLQWGGTITTIEDDITYTYTITMPSALTKSDTSESYSSGQLVIIQDTATLTAMLSEGNRAAITLDLEGDDVLELDRTITLTR